MKLPIGFDHHELYTSSSACGPSSALHHDEVKKSRKRISTVRISEEDNVVHELLPLCEYTPEEVRSCWFSRVEYNSFKRSSLITLNLNRGGKLALDDSERTMRGLECRTRECTDSRRALRDSATGAVLSEQFQQRRLDVWDPQAVADQYHSVSWKSQYTAYTQGLADEQDAQETSFEERFFGLGSSSAASSTAVPATKRNSVLSSIISIDSNEPEPFLELELEEETPIDTTIAGFDCDLWTSNATDTFNLNNFFNEMSWNIAVGAA